MTAQSDAYQAVIDAAQDEADAIDTLIQADDGSLGHVLGHLTAEWKHQWAVRDANQALLDAL